MQLRLRQKWLGRLPSEFRVFSKFVFAFFLGLVLFYAVIFCTAMYFFTFSDNNDIFCRSFYMIVLHDSIEFDFSRGSVWMWFFKKKFGKNTGMLMAVYRYSQYRFSLLWQTTLHGELHEAITWFIDWYTPPCSIAHHTQWSYPSYFP